MVQLKNNHCAFFFILMKVFVHSSNACAMLGLWFIVFVLTVYSEYLHVKHRKKILLVIASMEV